MKKRLFAAKGFLGISLAGIILTGYVGSAMASGFQLFEENGVGTGDYDAGGAAIADDASTAFYNPAGLTRIDHQQFVAAGDGVLFHSQFTGTNTWSTNVFNPTTAQPLLPPVSFTGTAQGGRDAVVPSFYYSAPINPAVVFAMGVAVPFGLSTQWSDGSVVSYSATESTLTVFDFTPNLGVKITDQFSVGAGADIDRLNATLSTIAGLPSLAISQGLPSSAFDTESENTASDWGYGYHVGVLYAFTPQTRVGLAYHSQVTFSPTGSSTFTGPLAATPAPQAYINSEISNNGLNTNITVPAFTMLSAYSNLTPIWAVMGSVTYTQWSVFNNLQLNRVEGAEPDLLTTGFDPTQVTVSLPQDFRNTWRVSVGTSLQVSDQWLLRAGTGYDENPTNNVDRNIRLPDGNRFALAIGAHYQVTHCVGFDAGYTHLFINNGDINNTVNFGPQTVSTVGKTSNYANVVGAQITWDIV